MLVVWQAKALGTLMERMQLLAARVGMPLQARLILDLPICLEGEWFRSPIVRRHHLRPRVFASPI
jgi:hypothetical protein